MSDATEPEEPKPRPAASAPVFTREQLALAARRRLEAESAAAAGGPRRRVPAWRLGLWLLECIVLLALLEAFVLRPTMARRQASRATLAALPAPVLVSALALGERAQVLPGLKEVVPAFLAAVEGLATGSETMRSAQQSFSAAARLPVEVENSLGMRFRLVPPGTAILGSPPEEAGRGDREVQHVFVAPEPFYLGVYEVTQAEWGRVMPTDPSHYKGALRPVEEVTWYDCQQFLVALCRLEGIAEGTYRLPTESEWEYACRAGTSTAYSCGNDPRRLDPFATHGGNGGSGTTAVGLKRPNGLGLHDFHGNVWEWCLNRFAPYTNDKGSADPEHESWRCLRGGNWYVPPLDCRSAARNRLPPASKGNMLGFRVLRTVTPAAKAAVSSGTQGEPPAGNAAATP